MQKRVLETITKYNLIESGDKLVLGVSGGPDSICMLEILNQLKEKLNFEIVVAHINHGIRENAILDEKYVEEYCKKLDVEYYVLKVKLKELSKEKKIGLEEAGRKVRYDFFDTILEKTKSNKIAIAHNKNDRVETIILNILRGSGSLGLKGIEPKNGKYIRPIIEIERSEVEDFCLKNNINPRIDESNFENEFSRNRVRNVVIPYIKEEFNPNIVETIIRMSDIISEENEFLEEEIYKQYNNILIEEINLAKDVYNNDEESTIILDLKKFNSLNKVLEKRILLYAIKRLFGSTKNIEKVHLEDMIKLCNNNIGNKFLTPNKKTKIVIKNKKIYISSIK